MIQVTLLMSKCNLSHFSIYHSLITTKCCWIKILFCLGTRWPLLEEDSAQAQQQARKKAHQSNKTESLMFQSKIGSPCPANAFLEKTAFGTLHMRNRHQRAAHFPQWDFNTTLYRFFSFTLLFSVCDSSMIPELTHTHTKQEFKKHWC